MSDKEQLNRDIVAGYVDKAVTRGEIRPHERERAIDLGVNNWRGQTGVGCAVEAAVDAVKKGL